MEKLIVVTIEVTTADPIRSNKKVRIAVPERKDDVNLDSVVSSIRRRLKENPDVSAVIKREVG